MTLVSVVIPTKNRPESVADAVRSVFAGAYQQFEIFVIDQSTDDATQKALAGFAPEARFHYVRNRTLDAGPSSSRNIGIALSSGDIVAHIDDDVTVCKDWLANMVAEFAADPELQFICGKLSAPSYDWQTGFIPTFDPEQFAGCSPHWSMVVMTAGANYSMRRAVFDRLGGYNEAFGPGTRIGAADDGNIAMRIMRSGAKWKPCKSVEVVHTHGFRAGRDAAVLRSGYARGIGSTYGHVTRQGDLIPGLWFLLQAVGEIGRIVVPNVLLGRRPTRFGGIRDRLVGFWHGLLLPPHEGCVSPDDLAQLRRHFIDTAEFAARRAELPVLP